MEDLSISDGAAELLTIARENDKKDLIATNICLRLCLETLKNLPQVCKFGSSQELFTWLQVDNHPSSFLGLCAQILNSIDLKVKDSKTAGGDWSNSSDFDHGILLGMAQTLAEAAAIKEGAQPSLENAIERIGKTDPLLLQMSLIENYIGNLLQDYFDMCGIRIKNPSLPVTTEEDLRYEDAYSITEYLFGKIGNDKSGYGAGAIQQELGAVLMNIKANA